MKIKIDILKTSMAVMFAATVGFSCSQDRPRSDPPDDTSTSEAIVRRNPKAANLARPRPAPIGDTARTAEEALRFGELPPNADADARRYHEENIRRQQEKNPDQRPKITTPPHRRPLLQGKGEQQNNEQ